MNNLNIGITGDKGFIGSHLSIAINYFNDNLTFVPSPNKLFEDQNSLNSFVKKCDVIVHLAAMNRGDDSQIFQTNITLIKQLIKAIQKDDSKNKHVIFASSTQRELNNSYGKSKKEGEKLLKTWKFNSNGTLTNLIIPNVFGPFCKPFYNSVISTFCYQINEGEIPEIKIDAEIGYKYIDNLVEVIIDAINGKFDSEEVFVKPDKKIKVSEILSRLEAFKNSYILKNIIPKIKSNFDIDLFNTFRSYIKYDKLLFKLDLKKDDRGTLFEIVKEMTGGQAFFSTTKPGIVRGNHFHTKKIERFCVVSGEAKICLRKINSNNVIKYKVSGDSPVVIDMPIFHTHNIENIGKSNLLTLFWSNEIYDENNPDTFFEEV